MVWGRGSVVRDVNGKEYLDFNSGQMCGALGHNHPRITQALQESCETLIHSHMSMFNDKEIILAARLAEITPDGMDRSMFLTSGSDSNEAAMAIAKRYTGGYEIASPAVSMKDTALMRLDTTRYWRHMNIDVLTVETAEGATIHVLILALTCSTPRPTGSSPV